MKPPVDEVADAYVDERAKFRAVVRWRALYSRRRKHMTTALHYRLKDYEYDAIDAHRTAERRLHGLVAQSGGTLCVH
jgi:3'-phosphoadenosine 5'-phosphosulfate sulfotransferase